MEKITFISYQHGQKLHLLGAPVKEKVWPLCISHDDCVCGYLSLLASLCFQYPHFPSQNHVSVPAARLEEFLGSTVSHLQHKAQKQESHIAFAFLLLLPDFWVFCCNTNGSELPEQAWWCNLLISWRYVNCWHWRGHFHLSQVGMAPHQDLQFSTSNAEKMLLTQGEFTEGVHRTYILWVSDKIFQKCEI